MRESRENAAKQELAGAISRLTDSQEDLRSTEAQIEQTHGEHRSAISDSNVLPASELLARQAFLEHIEARRTTSAETLERREAEVADRDASLTRAASEHEMLKRLKERHRTEHEREAARRESNTLDEIAIGRHRGSAA
jgi:flagellar export protein FliJ